MAMRIVPNHLNILMHHIVGKDAGQGPTYAPLLCVMKYINLVSRGGKGFGR